MLAGLFALVILVLRLFPETPFARALHRGFVELPFAWASRIRRTDILMIAILLVAGQSFMLAGSIDLAIVFAADLSLYLDAAIAVSTAAAVASLRTRWAAVKAVFRVRSRGKTRPAARPRSRRSRLLPRVGNDDEDDRAVPLAA